MKYQIIYEVIRDELGDVVDLVNRYELRTQNEVGKWLGATQSEVSRATIKTFTKKHVDECSPIKLWGSEYVIIRG